MTLKSSFPLSAVVSGSAPREAWVKQDAITQNSYLKIDLQRVPDACPHCGLAPPLL